MPGIALYPFSKASSSERGNFAAVVVFPVFG